MTGAHGAAFRDRMLSAVRYFASAPDLNDARRELAALLAYGPGAVTVFDEIVNELAAAGTLPRPALMSLRAFALHVQRSNAPRAANPAWLDLPPDDGAPDETVLIGSEDAPEAAPEADTGDDRAEPDAVEQTEATEEIDEAAEADLPKGTVCADRYIVDKPIAIGGMSTVYRAIDDRSGKPVALKVLRRTLIDDPDQIAAFEREADNAWALRDPHFVKVLAQGWIGKRPFLALELLEGQSLGAALKTQFATGARWPLVRRLLTAIGTAIGHAHANGLVHADLKPGNIFLQRDGEPKILDLGAVQVVHGDTRLDLERDHDLSGGALTPAYASPEMLLGASAEPRDDVFALAVIGYELLAGRHPFDRYSADRARHLDIRPTRPRGIPAYAWRMLRRGLALRRDRRPPSMKAFVAGLQPPFPTATLAGCAVALLAVVGAATWSQANPDRAATYLENGRQARELAVDLLGLRPLPRRPVDSLAAALRLAQSTGWTGPRDRLTTALADRMTAEVMTADPPSSLIRGTAALATLREVGLLGTDAAEAALSVTRTLAADLTRLVQEDERFAVEPISLRLELLRTIDPDAVRLIAPHLTNLLNERRHGLRTDEERERFDAVARELVTRYPVIPPPVGVAAAEVSD